MANETEKRKHEIWAPALVDLGIVSSDLNEAEALQDPCPRHASTDKWGKVVFALPKTSKRTKFFFGFDI